MKPLTVTFDGTWEDEANHRDFDYTVSGTCYPYVPGKTYGDPDDCYPAEPARFEDWEVTLDSLTVYDRDGGSLVVSFDDSSGTWRDTLTEELRAYLEQNESQLAERAFEIAEDMSQERNEL